MKRRGFPLLGDVVEDAANEAREARRLRGPTRAELIERAVREALFPEEMQGTMSCKRRDTCPQCQDLLTRVRSAFARLTSGADSVGSLVAANVTRDTLKR